MALRIAGPPKPEPDEQEEPEQETQEAPESGDSETAIDDDEMGLPKLLPGPAGYMGPENGPFMCQNCVYFEQPSACHIVSGPIAPDGCCNLFTRGNGNQTAETPENAPETSQADYAPAAPGGEGPS